jgi:hypothetical protein
VCVYRRQSSRTVIKIVEGGGMLSKGMEAEHNHNYVVRKDEILSSHENSPDEDYTQLVNEIVEEEDVEDESLMKCSDQHKEMMPDETQESHGFKTDHWCVYAGYEDNHKENKGVEEQHSDIMLTDYDEELRLLEEWLINPKIEGDCIVVADTKSSMIHDLREEFEASRGEEEVIIFQTNCLSEYENYRQPKMQSCLGKVNFCYSRTMQILKSISMDLRTSERMKTKELEADIWSPYEGQNQHRTDMDIEIDEMWKADDEEVQMEIPWDETDSSAINCSWLRKMISTR